MDSEVYSFVVEWVDRNALNLKKEYKLNYFVKRGRPGEVEMYDCKTRQLFLKRCPYPSLELKELHVGSKVIVFSRQLTVIKYGDEFTSQAFTSSLESSFLFITPSGLNSFHDVLGALFAKDLKIAELRSVALSQSDSMTAFRDEHFSSGLSIAVSVVGNEAVGKIMDISSEFRGQVIPATSQDEANKFAQMFLSKDRMESCQVSTASFSNEAALLIIRPHACREGLTSSILKDIYDAGCSISSAQVIVCSYIHLFNKFFMNVHECNHQNSKMVFFLKIIVYFFISDLRH
eukprot:TRINITY_DN37060_c0_g5_i2.p1 TRINITY_DN37060_c0_g5~~TRINITY_DN37060_c0_g5_i2.p1  ORF type:complete len:289 (+),score=24.41 TRINITY_DN37060_c0_g5_i2:152-1018(+)